MLEYKALAQPDWSPKVSQQVVLYFIKMLSYYVGVMSLVQIKINKAWAKPIFGLLQGSNTD